MVLLETECVSLSPDLGRLQVVPLHSGLTGLAQRAYESCDPLEDGEGPEGRKVIVSDRLAEASFSLQNIRYVIDTGLMLRTVRLLLLRLLFLCLLPPLFLRLLISCHLVLRLLIPCLPSLLPLCLLDPCPLSRVPLLLCLLIPPLPLPCLSLPLLVPCPLFPSPPPVSSPPSPPALSQSPPPPLSPRPPSPPPPLSPRPLSPVSVSSCAPVSSFPVLTLLSFQVYSPQIRANSQVLTSISRHQADMRSERVTSPLPGEWVVTCAGRQRRPTSPHRPVSPVGLCVRLYAPSLYEQDMVASPRAGVMEENLSHLVLLLKRLDIADMGQCKFLDRPGGCEPAALLLHVDASHPTPPSAPTAPEALMQALEDLDYLAALDDDGNLSEVGIIMSELPLEPLLAKALIASCEYECVDELLTIAAMLTGTRAEHTHLQRRKCPSNL